MRGRVPAGTTVRLPADHKDIAFVDHDIFRKSGCAVVVDFSAAHGAPAGTCAVSFFSWLGETCCELVQNRYRMEARGGRACEGP